VSRLCTLLAAVALLLRAQSVEPAWKEFKIGPVHARQANAINNVRHGEIHTGSISLKALVGIAANIPTVRIVGPFLLDSEYYAVDATLADETRLRMRFRSKDDPVAVDFRALLSRELARRFHLEYHREMRQIQAYLLQPATGTELKARPSTSLMQGRVSINESGSSGNSTLDGRNVTFRSISNWLQGRLRVPVTLAESLPEGTWYFHLQWKTKDDSSLAAALKDQLGLELIEAPQNQEYVVVDHIERLDFPARI